MTETKTHKLHIIGGGLAGSEAAWQAAQAGIIVTLYEMRPEQKTPAHQTQGLAELVCSNSFRSDDSEYNAVGLLHEEMRRMDSLIMREADKAAVPAGGALAVDREIFSNNVTKALETHPNISIIRKEVLDPFTIEGDAPIIIATGPLTSSGLADTIQTLTGQDALSFFDAIAPIIYTESINMDKAWYQSRYDKEGPRGTGKDYINCAFNEQEYNTFVNALIEADKIEFKDWEKDTPYFEGCMPVEVMATRGPETLRFGPMKPVGLTNPHSDEKPYAVLQLRQDNALASLYNMVGFQTKMRYGEQERVFRTVPGLEQAEFARLGGLHRNTFINSPKVLDEQLRLKNNPRIRFAGQITGCEGYVESAAMGLLAGRMATAEQLQQDFICPPNTTAFGAMLEHVTGGADEKTFQPMNINFGLFPPLEQRVRKGKERKKAMSERALKDLAAWQEDITYQQ